MRIKDFSHLYEGWETNEREFEFVGLSYILNDSIDMKAQNSFIFPPLKASHSNCQRKNKKSDEGMKNRFTHKFEGHQHSFILCKKSEKSWWIRLSFWYLIYNILIKAIKMLIVTLWESKQNNFSFIYRLMLSNRYVSIPPFARFYCLFYKERARLLCVELRNISCPIIVVLDMFYV